MTFDRPMYLVVVQHPKGPYIPETDIDRTDHATVSRLLREGQFENVVAILELDPNVHTFREVTHDFDIFGED